MKDNSWATTIDVLTRLLVAITPLIPVLVKLIKDLFRRGTPADLAKEPAPEQASPGGIPPQRLSELSLALAYSAIFSLLWASAIGVSGQLPSWSSLILLSLVLTLFLTAFLVLSWRRDRFSLSLAALAALSLLVVGLTRGGPFFPGEGGEEAMSSTMPLLTVFIILASLLLYLRSRWSLWLPKLSKQKWIIPATLAAGGALVAAAGGVEYTRGLYASEKTLQVSNDQARNLLLTLNAGSLQLRRLFYQLASEIRLAPFYQQQYLALQPAASKEEPGEPLDGEDNGSPDGEDFMAMFSRESAGQARQCLGPEIFVQAVKYGSPETYMANRLRWVHPLGDGKKAKVGIPLPGRIAEDRLRETAKHRIYKSLEGQEKRRASLLAACTYPTDLRQALSGEERANPLDALNPLGTGEKFESKEGILPEFEPHNGNSILEFQMALPVAEESRTAFAQYRQIGLALEGNPKLQQLAARFETLEPDVQSAFNQYLGDPATRLKNYELLRDLADVKSSFEDNFDPMTAVGTLAVVLPDTLPGTAPRTEVPNPSQPAAGPAGTGAGGAQGAADASSAPPEPKDGVEELGAALVSHLKNIDKTVIREDLLRNLRALLKQNDPAIPVIHLFRRQSLDFVQEIYRQGLGDKDVERLLEICSRPVAPTIRRILQKSALVPQSERKDLESALEAFTLLPADDQEAVLHLVANQFYRIQEPDELLSLGVAIAGIYGRHLDVLAATVYFLPIVLLAIWTGAYFSRVLAARDVLWSSIAQENKRGESPLPTFALGAAVIGREPVLRQLTNLARRGWGTIALVGQRGIGKTRILQEVINGESGDGHKPHIGVWITAPARFDEREFVTSTLEQVSTQVERTVAQYLDAQPLAVRELEARLRWGWLIHLTVLLLVFNALLSQIESALSEPMLVLALTPTFLILLGALCVGVYYWSRLQPVDLTSWLQERQSTHAQAALMYREAVEVVQASRDVGVRAMSPVQRQVRAYQRGLLWSLGLLDVLITVSFLLQPTTVEAFLILFLSILWLWIFSRRQASSRASDDSLMSLLRRYREYVSNVVRRLEMGALGDKKGKGVVICIDELDKIVNLEEVKEFVRRIKGIFEVPGVYYHISLAEDAFSALYLGSVEGKNEIDSSFDHIVRIMPLSADEATELVQAQLKRIEIDPGDARTARAIAAVSFGNPRDALRLCDELVDSRSQGRNLGIAEVIANRRMTEARSSYELQRIRRDVYTILAGDPADCRSWARNFFAADGDAARASSAGKVPHIVLGCWLLALIELALHLESEEIWVCMAREVCEIGGQVAIMPVEDLVARVLATDDILASAWRDEALSSTAAS